MVYECLYNFVKDFIGKRKTDISRRRILSKENRSNYYSDNARPNTWENDYWYLVQEDTEK